MVDAQTTFLNPGEELSPEIPDSPCLHSNRRYPPAEGGRPGLNPRMISGSPPVQKLTLKSRFAFFAVFALVVPANAQLKQSAFGKLAPDDPSLDNTSRTLTDDDLADPPPGEIRKMYLHDVSEVCATLSANLAVAPPGAEGQQSPWMVKFQAIKSGMDQIVASRSQRDVFNLIPKMQEVFAAGGSPGYSNLFAAQGGVIRSLGVVLVHSIAEDVTDQNAIVTAADLTNFVTVFSVSGYMLAPDWENRVLPIDAAGVMILDATAVVAQLKSLPWKQAERFLGGCTPSDAFEDYESAGEGLPVLKAKYAADKASISAKWQELATWVSQQKAANP